MSIQNLQQQTFDDLFPNSKPFDVFQIFRLLGDIVDSVSVIEGTGAPTFTAKRHSWYIDTATQRYYRNTDGNTNWVALN